MMQLMTTQHGWAMTPRGIPPQAGQNPPFGAPPPLLPAAPRPSCPAALGAPPGEESTFYPPVPAARFPTHQAGQNPTFGAPPPLPQAAPRPRCPAVLGASPGEESTSYPPVSRGRVVVYQASPDPPPRGVSPSGVPQSDPLCGVQQRVPQPDDALSHPPAALAGMDELTLAWPLRRYPSSPNELPRI